MNRVHFALVVASLFALTAVAASPPPNFGVVIEDGIYRGGQPDDKQLAYLRDLGVKTILKLNEHDLEEEQATAQRLGLQLIDIPFDARTIGSKETCDDVAQALAILSDRTNWPIYVHCSRGRDRTGYLVGTFREIVQHWSWKDVDRELASYGHTDSLRRAYPLISLELQSGTPTCAGKAGSAAAAP